MYKVEVDHPKLNQLVQEHAFKLGYRWSFPNDKRMFFDDKILYFNNDTKRIFSSSDKSGYKSISIAEFLNLPIEIYLSNGYTITLCKDGMLNYNVVKFQRLDNVHTISVGRIKQILHIEQLDNEVKFDHVYHHQIIIQEIKIGCIKFNESDINQIIELIKYSN